MKQHTLQEIADFFDMAAAVDDDGRVFLHTHRPTQSSGNWFGTDPMADVFLIERDLIDYTGDWRDSLTLPEGWTKEPTLPFKEGELVVHLPSGNMYPWAAQYAPDSHRRPTEAEWAVLRGEG